MTNDSTKYLLVFFRLLGILMPEKNKLVYVVYSAVVNVFSSILLPLCFTLSYVTDMPLSQLLTSLQIGINVYACVAKFVVIALKKRNLLKIRLIVDQLDEYHVHPDNADEIRNLVKFGHRMVLLFCIAYFSYSTTTFLAAVCNGHPPYSLYNPIFDWRASQREFLAESLLEFVMINLVCLQDVATDSFAVIHVRIVHTHFRILIRRVSRIGSTPDATQDDNFAELVRCIRTHRKLIELSDALGEVISLTIFAQFMTSSLALGIALINIRAFGNGSAAIGSTFFIGGVVWELLPVCYLVNCLAAEAERLPHAIFHMNWMDQSKNFQRNCVFFMLRSQRSVVFSAGKVFPISLETFISIVKFSFSLYTLLRTMDLASGFSQE